MALEPTEVELTDIIANAAIMMRVKLDKQTVTKYAKAMECGAQFPPILIFKVDEQFILADGFHRLSAYQRLNIRKIRAEIRIGTIDDAILAAVRADAHEGLKRTNADKEKAVKALLTCEYWRAMSDREIAREAGVANHIVGKLRKVSIQVGSNPTSNATNKQTRVGKDGKRYPATRAKPAAASAWGTYKPPKMPVLTREQIGAPAEGTEKEQDPDSPPGVTRAQAFTRKHGHVHIRPLAEKERAAREKTATSFVAVLRDLIKLSEELLKHSMEPADLFTTLREMSGKSMLNKFEERMGAIEPLLTNLNAINAMRAKKVA